VDSVIDDKVKADTVDEKDEAKGGPTSGKMDPLFFSVGCHCPFSYGEPTEKSSSKNSDDPVEKKAEVFLRSLYKPSNIPKSKNRGEKVESSQREGARLCCDETCSNQKEKKEVGPPGGFND
jgi:hypothetical protein